MNLVKTSRKWTEKPTLFIKIGGLNKTIIDALVKEVREISKSHNSTDFQFATDDEEKTELWSARKVALWSTINQGRVNNPNIQIWTTDAAVPFSNLPKFLTETKEDIDDHGLQNTLVSHIGDGNAHSFILYDPLAKTTVTLNTFSFMVPYLYALVPEHEVAHIPPISAPGPGSGPKKSL